MFVCIYTYTLEFGRMLSTNREIVFRVRVVRDVSCVRSCGREFVSIVGLCSGSVLLLRLLLRSFVPLVSRSFYIFLHFSSFFMFFMFFMLFMSSFFSFIHSSHLFILFIFLILFSCSSFSICIFHFSSHALSSPGRGFGLSQPPCKTPGWSYRCCATTMTLFIKR